MFYFLRLDWHRRHHTVPDTGSGDGSGAGDLGCAKNNQLVDLPLLAMLVLRRVDIDRALVRKCATDLREELAVHIARNLDDDNISLADKLADDMADGNLAVLVLVREDDGLTLAVGSAAPRSIDEDAVDLGGVSQNIDAVAVDGRHGGKARREGKELRVVLEHRVGDVVELHGRSRETAAELNRVATDACGKVQHRRVRHLVEHAADDFRDLLRLFSGGCLAQRLLGEAHVLDGRHAHVEELAGVLGCECHLADGGRRRLRRILLLVLVGRHVVG